MQQTVILIGMPGCGKSVIGRQLAEALQRPFLDLDEEVEANAGKKISEIFATDGEMAFRKIETKCFENVAEFGGVLATGGGIVTRPENRAIARKGIVVFLDRPLEEIMEDIITKERPLLKDGKERLHRLYQERYSQYCDWAEIHIKNQGNIKDVINQIIKEVEVYENHGY